MNIPKNAYRLSKTLRFGLTLSDAERKRPSHTLLKELVRASEQNIINGLPKDEAMTEESLVNLVGTCIEGIQTYLHEWEQVYIRADQVALTKDYYRRLARKARFDAIWKDRNEKKQPQSQMVKLSALGSKYEGKERKEYLLDYWAKNLKMLRRRLRDFRRIQDQYETALEKKDHAHKKPSLVDFRKMFLSIAGLTAETMQPLVQGSINFPGANQLTEEDRNLPLIQFLSGENRERRRELFDQIGKVRQYFEDNGGYVHYGRATLNRYTAEQKPHVFDKEIGDIIGNLKLVEVVNKLGRLTDDEIRKHLEFSDLNKQKAISENDLSLLEKIQLFKYKPVPATVRFALADYLQKRHGLDRENTLHILDLIGQPQSLGEIYKKTPEHFDLRRFPLKPAFDYAWENLARVLLNPSAVNFPEEQCREFLKENFGVDTGHSSFRLYADLLFIRENLATLDHPDNGPVDREKHIENVRRTIRQVTFPYRKNDFNRHRKVILDWIDLSPEDQSKKRHIRDFRAYEIAKRELGQLRGKQKNNVRRYEELTEKFKRLAIDFGKNFADLREKFREENELNKISHYGIILEDDNEDRYLLLKLLGEENREADAKALPKEVPDGELKTFRVKSLTSKALEKMIKNKGGYKDFQLSNHPDRNNKVKREWATYQNDPDFLDYLRKCMTESKMAKAQDWAEFGFDLSECETFEAIAQEVDRKGHILKAGKTSVQQVEKCVSQGCLLLPVVNQDITSASRKLKNRFSKDWAQLFDEDGGLRLHPEFRISYRHPTPDYPEKKRYSRFQMIAHFLTEFVPESGEYHSRKEQIRIFNDPERMQKEVAEFNRKIVPGDDYHVIGIDRGLKQLATLCVLDKKGRIQGDFEIYTRRFNAQSKQWEHTLHETRNILDLSNLRAETTIEGRKVLVDLSLIPVRVRPGQSSTENQQKIKLKQLAYMRKLQYRMQFEPDLVLNFIRDYPDAQQVETNIEEMISWFKEGVHYEHLPMDRIMETLALFKQYKEAGDEKAVRELCELDAADSLKKGVVANMIGVVVFLLERYDYKAIISLENLTRSFFWSTDGLTGDALSRAMDFKKQENLALAGLSTYHYFEMQLLKKLLRIPTDQGILHLVPAFRSVDNYEMIRKLSSSSGEAEYTCKPFGMVHFVDPMYTSRKCPACGSTNVKRDRKDNDAVKCQKCGFETTWNDDTREGNERILQSKGKLGLNIFFIENGDQNGAYHIALKTLRNL